MMLRCTVFGAISSGELFTAKATFRLNNMRQNFPKSLLATRPQSISFSANPTYHCMSILIFSDPLVFRLIPATGNLKSRFRDAAGQHFIVSRSRGNGFLTGSMFSRVAETTQPQV